MSVFLALGRRHALGVVRRQDAADHFALGRLARHDRRRRPSGVGLSAARAGRAADRLAGSVGAVAGEAVVRQDRQDVAAVIDGGVLGDGTWPGVRVRAGPVDAAEQQRDRQQQATTAKLHHSSSGNGDHGQAFSGGLVLIRCPNR